MKFITEEDLRDSYRKEPFTSYDLEPGARLTPGARQFLADRGINMFDNEPGSREKGTDIKQTTEQLEKTNVCKNRKLISRMNSIEALFLMTGEELLRKDVCLAQSLINLNKQFTGVKNALKGRGMVDNLCCSECTGINKDNFSCDLDDCFEITDFHIQLEKGREIVVLHRLRCELNELKIAVTELFEGTDEGNVQCGDVVCRLNQIVNSLSQLICSAFGGKKCLRQ